MAAGVPAGDMTLRIANALGIVGFGSAVWYLAGTVGLSLTRRVVLIVVALGSGVVVMFNLTNGLETGWAIATLTFAIACARAGRPVLVGSAAGLLPFLRPDLAPASLVVLSWTMYGRPRHEQIRAVGAAVLVAAPWLIWTRLDTGVWLTQTMRAKQLFFAEGCRPWTDKATTVLRATVVGVAQMFPLCLGVVDLARDKLGRAGLLAIAMSVIAYFVAFPGALEQPFFRYPTAIWLPWLSLGAAMTLARLPVAAGLGIAFAVVVAQTMFGHGQNAAFSRDIKDTAEWIDATLPKAAVLLVHDAGGISEFAHHRAVDLVGLKTPSSMAAHARWTWPSCAAERGTAVSDIARRSGAEYFVAVTGWDEDLRPSLVAGGFDLTPVRQPPRSGGYTVYRLMQSAHGPDR